MMRRSTSLVGVAAALVAGTAWAQQTVDQGNGASPPAAAAPSGATSEPAPQDQGAPPLQQLAPARVAPVYGVVAPPLPGQPIGGGNATESSARPVTGDKEDTFDLGPHWATGPNGAATAYGDKSGPVFLGGAQGGSGGGAGGGVTGGVVPFVHSVRKGDTLWAICDQYFRNPYQWPRIWSYNPQLQNPHWIYPGDQVHLRAGGAGLAASDKPTEQQAPATGSFTDRRRQYPADTIFLRDTGYVEDDKVENWGDISGAPEDRMFLADFDQVYLHLLPEHDVKLGQELTVYRPTRSVGKGTIVEIQGTVRIDQWDPKLRIARAQIVESLNVIERGARIGPIGRRFNLHVPPARTEVDLKAEVLASVYPHNFYGQNQLVFLNKGASDGLKPGNVLFVIRRGDAWRQSLATASSAQRIKLESNSPAEIEHMPRPRDEGRFPEEVVAEMRILTTRANSSAALVTQAMREIELGDVVVARKGY